MLVTARGIWTDGSSGRCTIVRLRHEKSVVRYKRKKVQDIFSCL